MKSVYILQHSYESSVSGEEETKLIGAYSGREKAEQAIERLRKQPGFKDLPDYFSIEKDINRPIGPNKISEMTTAS